jgi:hypothetical protein
MVQIYGDSTAEGVGKRNFVQLQDINIEQVSTVNPLHVDFCMGFLTNTYSNEQISTTPE